MTTKKLSILLLALIIFSCNNQPSKDTTESNTEITSQTITKHDIKNQTDTAATNYNQTDTATSNYKQGFTYQPVNSNKTTPQVDNFIGFTSFYKHFDKPTQEFTIKSSENKLINCKEGTKITVKSNSFVTETGKPVQGNITIRVKEYYNISDILLANLTTTSNNEILETGGMLYLEAFSDGERCKLKESKTIEIIFPAKDKKEDMRLFSGKWTSEKINWTLEENEIVEEEYVEVFTIVETMPEFPGGQQKLMEYLSSNIRYPRIALENGIQGTVYIGFIINENGETEGFRILRGVDSTLNQAAISAVKQMPKWIPGKQRGKYVKVNMTIPVIFSLGGEGFNTNNTEYAKEFEKKLNNDKLSETKMSEISQYIFSTSKLGWINCDRFYKDNRPKTDYLVNIGNSKHIDIKIVFNNINSILTASKNEGKYTFDNVPIGHSITLVVLKYENDQYYLAVKKTRITRDGESALEFKHVTMARLKTEMVKLNRL